MVNLSSFITQQGECLSGLLHTLVIPGSGIQGAGGPIIKLPPPILRNTPSGQVLTCRAQTGTPTCSKHTQRGQAPTAWPPRKSDMPPRACPPCIARSLQPCAAPRSSRGCAPCKPRYKKKVSGGNTEPDQAYITISLWQGYGYGWDMQLVRVGRKVCGPFKSQQSVIANDSVNDNRNMDTGSGRWHTLVQNVQPGRSSSLDNLPWTSDILAFRVTLSASLPYAEPIN